ncbi:MAG: RrF2 family transcriptional regulator [Limisphaerales bacterium]
MLALSATTEYAIRALKCLARGDCQTKHVSDIARCTGVPRPYLAKVLSTLSRASLVQTKRGYLGGISLARGAEDISLLQIVEAIEGETWLADCLLGRDDCGVHADCPVHEFWARIRVEITEQFQNSSLASLVTCKHARSTATRKVAGRCSQPSCAHH